MKKVAQKWHKLSVPLFKKIEKVRKASRIAYYTAFWNSNNVGLARFERTTNGLGNRCSIQLSYSPVML